MEVSTPGSDRQSGSDRRCGGVVSKCVFCGNEVANGVRTANRMVHLILFLFFGGICVAGAVNLLLQRHPINSPLSLLVAMASLAGEYLLLGAEFVAAIQVIVYAGAIMV